MLIAFRVDASTDIGSGHVMRCLSLATELRSRGADILFICRAHLGHMEDMIVRNHFRVVMLPLRSSTTLIGGSVASRAPLPSLGAEVDEDVAETLEALQSQSPAWLVVDHYSIDVRWESQFKNKCPARIMAIDGLADRKHNCDLLLDPTLSDEHRSRWNDLVPPCCQLFIGPRFFPIRDEFYLAKRSLKRSSRSIKKVLISFGGIDQGNATLIALDALCRTRVQDVTVEVVLGSQNQHIDSIRSRSASNNKVNIHVQPSAISNIMAQSDIAISGGGGQLIEQCFMLLPSIVVSIAPNQLFPSKALHDAGAVLYLGDLTELGGEKISELIHKNFLMLTQDISRLKHMSNNSVKLFEAPSRSIAQIMTS